MDTIPLQRQYLFPAQPGIETNHHKYIRRQIFDRIQQLLGLCVGQSFFFFLRNASLGIEILGRIVLDQITVLGRVENALEKHIDLVVHILGLKYSPKDGHRKYAPSREMDSPYSTRLVLWTVKYTRSTKVDIENSTARQTDDRASVTSKIGGDILR